MTTPAAAGSAPPEGPSTAVYRFENVELDTAQGRLCVEGKVVEIEPRPMRLLLELVRHADEVLTKEELLQSVWDGRPTVEHVLANAISKLRTALGVAGAARLVTLPRVGYRLMGPVHRVDAAAPMHRFRPGQSIPGHAAWVLERVLGEGTRGDVWLARHAKLGHVHVFKFADDGARLSALKREYTLYRVLGQELGPRDDFAVVLDSNFAGAPYFLECQYGGESLQEWATRDGRLARLSLAERLALFVPIARAVAAAHSVGVLHKDLKPGNVLVMERPPGPGPTADPPGLQIRLTDFGSGHLLNPERLQALQLTARGMTGGDHALSDSRTSTLMYLAPEVLSGQPASTQSDVYALGMVLYQLLVGDLSRRIATGWERDIADPLLREDIRAATEGQPAQRLGSVAEFVERLERLPQRRTEAEVRRLDAERAASLLADAQRRRTRRPWLVATALLVVGSLLASLAFTLKLREALAAATQQTERATALNAFMAKDLVGGFGVGRVGQGGLVSMPEVLQRAADKAAKRFAAMPLAEAEVLLQIGQTHYRLSMFDDAVTQHRRALALLEPLAADAQARPLRTMLQLKLAASLADLNKLPEARQLLDQAGPDAQQDPTDPADPLSLAFAQTRLKLARGSQQLPAALAHAGRLVALTDGLPQEDTEARFSARFLLGELLSRNTQLDRAEAAFAELIGPRFGEAAVGPVQIARARIVHSRVRIAMGRTDGVEDNLIDARKTLLALLGEKEQAVAAASADLGSLYESRGDFQRAADAHRAAHAGYVTSLGADRSSARISLLNVAIAESNLGQSQAALDKLEAGRPWVVSRMGGEGTPVVQAIDFERGRALNALRRHAEAVTLLAGLSAEKLAQASPAKDWPARLQAERGRALVGVGRREDGLLQMRQALQGMQSAGSSAWITAALQQSLAAAERR